MVGKGSADHDLADAMGLSKCPILLRLGSLPARLSTTEQSSSVHQGDVWASGAQEHLGRFSTQAKENCVLAAQRGPVAQGQERAASG